MASKEALDALIDARLEEEAAIRVEGYDHGWSDGVAFGKTISDVEREEIRHRAYNQGYDDGHADGYGEGYSSATEHAFDEGLRQDG